MENITQPEEPQNAQKDDLSERMEASQNVVQRILQLTNSGRPKPKWEATRWYRVRNRSKKSISLTNATNEVLAIINPDTARALLGSLLAEVDKKTLESMEGQGELNFVELDYTLEKEYTLINLTSKRITIKHNAFQDREFFIPAFGSRNVRGKTLLELNYLAWESQGLLQIDPLVDKVKSSGGEAITSLVIDLLGFALVVGVFLAIFDPTKWAAVGMVSILGAIAIAATLFLPGQNTRELFNEIGEWLKLLPGITLVLGVGIGVPIGIIYFYGDGQQLLLETNRFTLATLGRLLQTGFISIASMLPAFLFYLFGRQQVTKQKENFYREAMILDPNVWSNSEAKNKYGPLLNSVYDIGKSPFSILLLVTSTALLVNGWIIALKPIGSIPDGWTSLTFFFTPDLSPFTFGFLGVYFFTINMIYRRYVRADLTPKTYAYITMRLLITVVLVWAVSTLPQFSSGSALEAGLSIVAFVIGIFPESGLTLIQEYFNKLTAKRADGNPEVLSLTKLEGMNLYDQARLMEEGIENIENLAHHNLMELIVRTRIPTARLVDMFDQAVLYLHLGPEDNQNRNLLKGLGIRTATDLIHCRSKIEDFKDDAQYADLIKKLDVIITSLNDDEWLNYIDSWRNNSTGENKPPIEDPYTFYHRAIGINITVEDAPESAKEKRKKAKRKTEFTEQPSLPPLLAQEAALASKANENPVH